MIKYLIHGKDSRARTRNLRFIHAIEQRVQEQESRQNSTENPVIFFIASAHIKHFGLGAAAGLISSWTLRLSGVPVKYYICQGGLSQCVLGSNRQGIVTPPPCSTCIDHRSQIYPRKHSLLFERNQTEDMNLLRTELQQLSWEQLLTYSKDRLELGKLCLPSLRWVERRYNLKPDPFTRYMLIEYILSALSLAREFSDMVTKLRPQAIVTMNGTHYPEAVVRNIAISRDIPVITFESGLRGDTVFFTHGIATEYPIEPPIDFVMGPKEEKKLATYLKKRTQGDFSLAGRKQWKGIQNLPLDLQAKTRKYSQIVPVFSNTVWDTSQAYADRFFSNMFEWLDKTLKFADHYPDTLFIVRAHPDEARPGKVSNETVEDWFNQSGYQALENCVFIPPTAQVSSYELIELAKFCIVYNSSIGLEAAALGKTVLPGGWTRYRNAHACLDITSQDDYLQKLQGLLKNNQDLFARPEWCERARRFYYFSQFKAVIDFSDYITHLQNAEYMLKAFPVSALDPEYSSNMRTISNGILHGKEFFV